MSELSLLAGKGKKFKVGELELEIKPLSMQNIDLMMSLGKEGPEQAEAMKTLITDATEEELDNVSVEHLNAIMEAITEVNNLGEGKDKDFLAKMKKAQSGKKPV